MDARQPHTPTAALAAIDMGSNSFRLEIGSLQHGRYRRIDYLKETVRLGAGLDANGMLTEEAVRSAAWPACAALPRGWRVSRRRRCARWPRRRCARRATATPSCCARRPRWAFRSRSSRAARKRA
jgi:hypothetical protein